MKKAILLLAIATFLVSNAFSTNVSGPISTNTVWTLANSPYIVTGNVLVMNGATLTIEPGVLVKFNDSLALQIDGTLIAQGTSSQKITFTSNTVQSPGAWGYIFFTNIATDATYDINGNYLSGSILEYCIIQYAGSANVSYNGAIRIDAAHPFINYCTISDNNASGIYAYNLTGTIKILNSTISYNTASGPYYNGGGICVYGGTAIISDNTISNNTAGYGGGIYVDGGCSATISNNAISNNNGYGGGICVGWCSAIISNNIITNNYSDDLGGGIYGWCSAIISNNIILNNTASEGGGIYIEDGTNTISNNIITNNNVTPYSGGSGAGIYIYNYDPTTICNNTIYENIADYASGIYYSYTNNATTKNNTITQNQADTFSYTISIQGFPAFTNNNIFANTTLYELRNENPPSSPPYLNVTNNWWGTTSDSVIQQKIYDWFDDASRGIVTYSPYLTTPDTIAPVSPPANVSKTNLGGGQIQITWSPNPEADIAGYRVYWGGFTGWSFTNSFDVGNDTSYILSGVSVTDTIGVTAYDNTYSPANEDTSTIVNDNMTNGNESWYAYARPVCNSIALTLTSVDASCSTCNDGTTTAIVTGGVIPYTYSWNTNPVQTTSTATALLPGTYTVTITDGNGCSLTDSVVVSFPTFIDEEINSSLITIYPNPANSKLFIESENDFKDAVITLYNINSQILLQQPLQKKITEFDISGFNGGIYFVKIQTNENVDVWKVVKE